ncbi:protein NRT1/ PTR FAMILY 5.4-like [Neltuma alba]|uniref:protein NRT1/ PTR FAMILY 5.4-like n=1 Tax=Neltuma alba TaxID=207710 RepID=UPI0010A3D9DD|nr:protein NRT1/ PTR FAMILY 5.4-like [Prosopis alba]
MAENGNGDALHRNQPSTSKGGWHAAIFIMCVEFTDRFAYYGLTGNLIQYLTRVLQEPNATASKNVNTFIGVSALFPLLGGFIADSYLGRFNTIVASSVIYLLGMIWLTLSASVLKNNSTLFFVGLYILSIGDGGHKPCVQTFAANQFDDNSPEEKIAKSSFFNFWYLGLVAGGLASCLVIYIEEDVGWAAGLCVVTGAVGLALVLFLVGIRRYRKEGPTGSPFTSMAQVFVAAIRKRRVGTTRDPHIYWFGADENHNTSHLPTQPKPPSLAHAHQFSFLDRAMIIDDLDASSNTRNPWRLCTVSQVQEVKLVLRLVPVWLSCLMFFVVQAQLYTFIVKQGETMVRSIGPHFNIPPASLQSIVSVVILITVPIYDRVFVPFARKLTGHPSGITVLQRIGLGLFVSIINMIVAALLESKRVGVARENNLLDNPKATLPMSIWWMLPQYSIFGISNALAIVGFQQLFYDEVAATMKSLGAAAYISLFGFGTLASNVVITVVQDISSKAGEKWLAGSNLNRAHLDSFYWVLAGLSAVNFCIYILVAKNFVYKKEINVIDSSINNNHNQV